MPRVPQNEMSDVFILEPEHFIQLRIRVIRLPILKVIQLPNTNVLQRSDIQREGRLNTSQSPKRGRWIEQECFSLTDCTWLPPAPHCN